MRNGTQEELDAAREDARLLPWCAKFKAKYVDQISDRSFPDGEIMIRGNSIANYDGADSVAFSLLDGSDYWYVSAEELEVIHD